MFITIEQQLQVYRLYRLHIICAHIMSQTNGLKMCVIGIIKLFTWCSVGWSSNLISYSIHIVYIPLPFGIYQHNVRGHSNYLQKFSTRIDDCILCTWIQKGCRYYTPLWLYYFNTYNMTYCSKYAVRVDTLWSQNACADRPTSDGQLYTMSRWHCSHYKHSVAHATYKLLLKRNGSLIGFLPRVPRTMWRRCVFFFFVFL